MPILPPHPCKRCGKLTSDKLCNGCKAKHGNSGTRQYDQQRGSSTARGYGYGWQKYRAAYIREHPICGDPYRRHQGQIRAAEHIDHIQAVSGADDPLFWRADNHQPLCNECHSYKTAARDGGFGNATSM